MAEQKPKEVILTTPRGVAKWPNLTVPQREMKMDGVTKPVTPNYSITLLLDPNDDTTVKLVADLNKAHEEGFAAAKAKTPKLKLTLMSIKAGEETDKDGTPTGKIAIGFKCKAEGVKKDGTPWTFRPAIKDAKGNPVPKDVLIYSGSVVKVAYTIRHTAMATGLFYTTFNLKAVQVLVLKNQSDRDAAFYGFQEEEGYGSETAEGDGTQGGESFTAGAPATGVAPASGAEF